MPAGGVRAVRCFFSCIARTACVFLLFSALWQQQWLAAAYRCFLMLVMLPVTAGAARAVSGRCMFLLSAKQGKGVRSWLGGRLAAYLSKPLDRGYYGVPSNPAFLEQTLQVGDVLLVEGRTRVSSTIKYLTQSTWSHAALYVGEQLHYPKGHVLIEADMREGVRSLPLAFYERMHTRICRPRDLTQDERKQVALYAISRLGSTYDLRHIVDLLRYTLPKVFFKPDMLLLDGLEFGSGDPTRAICSSLIAEAFYSVRYPVLAKDVRSFQAEGGSGDALTMPHYSVFTPRDFDVSPFFDVIKPSSWMDAQAYRPHLDGYVEGGLGMPEPAAAARVSEWQGSARRGAAYADTVAVTGSDGAAESRAEVQAGAAGQMPA